jgi:protein-S-isoprenylcysteine O-methyltransferase Ste14
MLLVMSLLVRNLIFTVVVPGAGAVYGPWWILTRGDASPTPTAWPAVAVIVVGAAGYLWCLWVFATVGRGTPGPWDAPRRVVAVGPYRWVRNPMYLAALLVVLGETWLFLSLPLLLYAGALAVLVALFVIGYEEPTLRRRFGESYVQYRRTVPRWIPRRPRT